MEVLGNIGDDRARNALTKALNDADERVVSAAAVALGKLGKESSVKYLAKLIKSPYSSVRCAAAQGLGHIGTASAVTPLVKLLCDRDWVTRMAAARALGQVGSRKAVGPLIKALIDLEWSVRLHSANALGQIGQKKDAHEALTQALEDTRDQVRRGAALALAKLGATEAIETLQEFTGTRQDDEAAKEIAEALASLSEEDDSLLTAD